MSLFLGVVFYLFFVSENYLRGIYFLIFWLILVVELIRFIEKTNRNITGFFNSLLQNDFTTTFAEDGKGKNSKNLYRALNNITDKFRELGSQKKSQQLFLEMLVQHIRVGILTIDEDERVYMVNDSFKNFVGIEGFHSLEGLSKVDGNLVRVIRKGTAGTTETLKMVVNNSVMQMTIRFNEFKMDDKHYKLVSMQDIKTELDEQEIDSWQKLIRVLTHEIMNSVSPIASLSQTLYTQLKQRRETGELDEKMMDNIISGLEAVQNRSEGLLHFTKAYRQVTKIPTPQLKRVNLIEMIDRLILLLEKIMFQLGIKCTFNYREKSVYALIDQEMFDQVIINLMKNAIEALEEVERPMIVIKVFEINGKVRISIWNNGPGIPAEVLENVFIPFYTTKPNGSGIGLALSRQIIQKHKGKIGLTTSPNEGTEALIEI